MIAIEIEEWQFFAKRCFSKYVQYEYICVPEYLYNVLYFGNKDSKILIKVSLKMEESYIFIFCY